MCQLLEWRQSVLFGFGKFGINEKQRECQRGARVVMAP